MATATDSIVCSGCGLPRDDPPPVIAKLARLLELAGEPTLCPACRVAVDEANEARAD